MLHVFNYIVVKKTFNGAYWIIRRIQHREICNPFVTQDVKMANLVNTTLTDSMVRSAKARDTRYDIFDAKLRGLGVRISTAGTKSFFVMRRNKGRMTRVTIGRYPELSLADARILGAEKLAELSKGTFGRRTDNPTVQQVYDEWIELEQSQKRTIRQVTSAMQLHVIPSLGKRKLNEVTKLDVSEIVERLVLAGKPTQANRVLAYIKRMFAWAEERGTASSNPASKVRKAFREVARHRVITRQELASLMRTARHLEPTFSQFFLLLMYLAQRRDEVAGMRWDELDLDERIWIIPGHRTKNGAPHEVQLSSQALYILSARAKYAESDLVFPATRSRTKGAQNAISGFSGMKKSLDEVSGVQDWRLHDVRRSFATHTTERLGVMPAVADKVLAHKTGVISGVAAIYNRAELRAERREALQKWADWLDDMASTTIQAATKRD